MWLKTMHIYSIHIFLKIQYWLYNFITHVTCIAIKKTNGITWLSDGIIFEGLTIWGWWYGSGTFSSFVFIIKSCFFSSYYHMYLIYILSHPNISPPPTRYYCHSIFLLLWKSKMLWDCITLGPKPSILLGLRNQFIYQRDRYCCSNNSQFSEAQ